MKQPRHSHAVVGRRRGQRLAVSSMGKLRSKQPYGFFICIDKFDVALR
jgi:hypothetical protein